MQSAPQLMPDGVEAMRPWPLAVTVKGTGLPEAGEQGGGGGAERGSVPERVQEPALEAGAGLARERCGSGAERVPEQEPEPVQEPVRAGSWRWSRSWRSIGAACHRRGGSGLATAAAGDADDRRKQHARRLEQNA